MGACCLDGDCSITTEEECDGSYQGDGTTCEGVDCGEATSGACCVGDVCSIESPDSCEGMGGIYQGDDTTCDPNPCVETPPCDFGCGGFLNPDDGLYYNKKIYTNSVDNSPCDALTCNLFNFDYYFHGDGSESFLTQQVYDSECNVVESHETMTVGRTCICNTNGLGEECVCHDPCEDDPGTLCYDDWCDEGGGDAHCGSFTGHTGCYSDPEDGLPYWTDCGVVTTVITYEEPCTP